LRRDGLLLHPFPFTIHYPPTVRRMGLQPQLLTASLSKQRALDIRHRQTGTH
jgi:hypothetical protein